MPEEVIVHPFEEIETDLVAAVNLAIKERFKIGVRIGERLPVPRESYSTRRRQYLSTDFLNALATRVDDDRSDIQLSITNVDLFVSKLNFVFGEASTTLRAAVFSTARLDPRAYGESENDAVLIRRATTEAVHELGHVFGLGHCNSPSCVMWFSNVLSETDRKGNEFCERCVTLLGTSENLL